jgi:hypothetical protein
MPVDEDLNRLEVVGELASKLIGALLYRGSKHLSRRTCRSHRRGSGKVEIPCGSERREPAGSLIKRSDPAENDRDHTGDSVGSAAGAFTKAITDLLTF